MRDYSESQEYAWDFIQRVKCASVQQMDFVLHNKFNITTGQVINVLHSLEQDFLLSVDSNATYVLNGTKASKFAAKYDIKDIQSLQVVLDVIGKNEVDDFDKIYKSLSGATMRFHTRDITFDTFVANLKNGSYIRFMDEKGKEQYEADKKIVGEERAIELMPKNIYIFPHEVNKKEAIKMVNSLNLFMPHVLAFITGSEYFEKQQVEYIN